MNKNLIVLAGFAAGVVVADLGYELFRPNVDRCEGGFQQTAPSLVSNVKFLESEGGVVLGRRQIQELSERAQEAALNLKACCLMSGDDDTRLGRFLACKNTAGRYEAQIAAAVQAIKQVTGAEDADKAARRAEAEERLQAIVQAATTTSKALERQVREIKDMPPAPAPPAGQPGKAASAQPGNLRLRAALSEGGDPLKACFTV